MHPAHWYNLLTKGSAVAEIADRTEYDWVRCPPARPASVENIVTS